jgi:protein-S-isoprenylcysteine O-methyltransferase Ste14
MKATDWEFRYRALVFGMIFGLTFPLYALDHRNAAVALVRWINAALQIDTHLLPRLVFTAAAVLLAAAALLRTWASAYLHAGVVYAAGLKTDSLVADGPYRQVRNPLYLANVIMAVGMGAMMSRTGCLVAVVAMLVLCYRLILREESELRLSLGKSYEDYRRSVPRLWPSLWPRIASAGRRPKWADGFRAESWYWAFPVAVLVFAVTLSIAVFYAILAAGLLWFWISSWARARSGASNPDGPAA